MTRAELIRRFVLNSICDDYEDIDRIRRAVEEEGAACGLTIREADILQALRESIQLGYAKAWNLYRAPTLPSPHHDIEPMNPRLRRTAQIPGEDPLSLFIWNSFENCTHTCLAHIEGRWKRLHQSKISRAQWIKTLRQLIELGCLEASYKDEGRQYAGMPPIDDIKPYGAYFWVTGTGWDYLQSDDSWWPFEDNADGELHLRSDWDPPSPTQSNA